MIVVMRRDAKAQDIEHMIQQVESLGLKPTVLRGTERTVIAAIGDERNAPVGILESGPGVDEVLPVLAPYKIASIETKSEPTVVRTGSLTVGGGHLGIMAGPCSVESEEQIVSSARAIKKSGATALRGGAYKPRTSPYAFQGLKEEGLKMLAAARKETGLAVVTEVVADDQIQPAHAADRGGEQFVDPRPRGHVLRATRAPVARSRSRSERGRAAMIARPLDPSHSIASDDDVSQMFWRNTVPRLARMVFGL